MFARVRCNLWKVSGLSILYSWYLTITKFLQTSLTENQETAIWKWSKHHRLMQQMPSGYLAEQTHARLAQKNTSPPSSYLYLSLRKLNHFLNQSVILWQTRKYCPYWQSVLYRQAAETVNPINLFKVRWRHLENRTAITCHGERRPYQRKVKWMHQLLDYA